MKLHGYDIGYEPTESEFDTYVRVERYWQRTYIAESLAHWKEYDPDGSFRMPTQAEFEEIYDKFSDARANSGEEEENDLRYAYEWVME